MTEENYNFRTSQMLLRNQFPGMGKLQIPIIPKFETSKVGNPPKQEDCYAGVRYILV